MIVDGESRLSPGVGREIEYWPSFCTGRETSSANCCVEVRVGGGIEAMSDSARGISD